VIFSRGRRAATLAAALGLSALTLLAQVGCIEPLSSVDGAVPEDGGASDLGANVDGGGRLGGAFTVIGCATLDSSTGSPRCSGSAPLELTFVPLGAGVDTFVWSFPGGDPSSSKALSPVVRYAHPGGYQVMLAAGGSAGTITASGTVLVAAGGLGAPCDDPSECDVASGLTCLCASGACPGGLSSGLCTHACSGGGCAPGEACADLTRGAPAPDLGSSDGGAELDGGAPNVDGGAAAAWRASYCLRGCAVDADCRPGFLCRDVPVLASGESAGGSYFWQRVCFADLLGSDGASCLGADEDPAPSSCLSGRCDPLGARGLCTSSCSAMSCPSQASCATFAGAPTLPRCLSRCDAQHPCSDPLLACQLPGGAGALGFTVSAGDPAGTTYCSPKRCTQPSDCAPSGSCTVLSGGTFCTRN
jgi:PKD repeat protein